MLARLATWHATRRTQAQRYNSLRYHAAVCERAATMWAEARRDPATGQWTAAYKAPGRRHPVGLIAVGVLVVRVLIQGNSTALIY